MAEGKRGAELDAELKVLVKRWEDAIAKVQKTQKRPQLVFEETGRAVALLRDLFNPSYENIFVNDEDVMKEVKHYVSLIAPDKANIVKLYTGKVPIFDNFNITKQIKSGFGRVVNYKHGAYLIIEHTEALHVVDVNSGNRTREKGQEANALDVNLGAADELARQLRLRDMGGIIVVDFIDMNLAEDRQMLYERMCKNMQKDRAKHNILPLSQFGLMQLTRQREVEHSVYRSTGKKNRPTGQQDWRQEVHAVCQSLCCRIHQQGFRFPSPEVAIQVWIRNQSRSFSETGFPSVRILRQG